MRFTTRQYIHQECMKHWWIVSLHTPPRPAYAAFKCPGQGTR